MAWQVFYQLCVMLFRVHMQSAGAGTRLQRASENCAETAEAHVDAQRRSEGEQTLGETVLHVAAGTASNDGRTEDFEDGLIDEGEDECDLDSEASRVEIGDTYVVYTDLPEHGDPFFLVLCDMPVHNNNATFTDGWGCSWPKDTMLISGTYYRRVPSVGRGSDSYRYELLEDEPKAWTYSHLVVQSRVELSQYKSNKRNPRFKMTSERREEILSNVEDRQAYNAH